MLLGCVVFEDSLRILGHLSYGCNGGGGGYTDQHYEGVRSNIISVMMAWEVSNFQKKNIT